MGYMNHSTLLLLEDARVFEGRSFAEASPTLQDLEQRVKELNPLGLGELVFTTSMTGYVETMTDPSYTGQIVCFTYPMIGNYGVDSQWAESASRAPSCSGIVVHELYRGPVLKQRQTLEAWALRHKISGIEGIDTRALTQHLRDEGSQNAMLFRPVRNDKGERDEALRILRAFPHMEGRNLLSEVSTDKWQEHVPSKKEDIVCTVVLYHCGSKQNILRTLLDKNCRVLVAPAVTKAEDILEKKPDMVLVSNGPGDPSVLAEQIAVLKQLQTKTVLCGICLGNQLLALSLGGDTFKMKFGHHGSNNPVQEEGSKKLLITSQNHGFAVNEKSLPSDTRIWYRNVNDNTVEGFYSTERKIYSVQFHPEACPGPRDAAHIFDFFIQKAMSSRKQG